MPVVIDPDMPNFGETRWITSEDVHQQRCIFLFYHFNRPYFEKSDEIMKKFKLIKAMSLTCISHGREVTTAREKFVISWT